MEDESVTNIQKLHVLFGGGFRDASKKPTDDGLIQINGGLRQRSFYYPGIGTYGGLFRRTLNIVLAPKHLFSDVRRILNAATENLVEHYEKGDHVLVFGFSRGAALARKFAKFAKEANKKSAIADLKIDFLGAFDTVAAISSRPNGIGTYLIAKIKAVGDVVLKGGSLSKDVHKAVHLVALDENRITFRPALFNYDPHRITEIWFPGTHSDVGGGYWHDGLSDLALEYMIKKVEQECVGFVLILDLDKVNYDQLTGKNDKQITEDDIKIQALVNGILHENKRTLTSIVVGVLVAGAVRTATITLIGTIFGIMFGVMAGALTVVGVIPFVTRVEFGDYSMFGAIISMTVGITVGVKVGNKIRKWVRKWFHKKMRNTLRHRDVRIAGNSAGMRPMVHVSVQDRHKEVAGYRPFALRDVEYVVVGNRIQPSKEEQKDSGLKYVVATDDKQVGKVRQGVSGLDAE